MALLRISFDAPPLGKVVKYFMASETEAAQDYIGRLQLKGYTVKVQRVDKKIQSCEEE